MAQFHCPVDGHKIVGLFEETLDPLDTTPVSFAHIDCDWYAPVMHRLTSICPRLSPGARVILDDYMDYGGCRMAAHAFLEQEGVKESMRFIRANPHAVLERV